MRYFKRLWLLIARRSYHSLCLFLVAFLFCCFTILCGFFGSIVDVYQELVILDTGYMLTLNRTDDGDIPQDALAVIEASPGVAWLNRKTYTLVTPVNFKNSVEQEASAFAVASSEQVKLIGSLRTDRNVTLQNHATLTEGIYPDALHPGILISETLANTNGLSLEDHLVLLCSGSNDEYRAPIIGIYRQNSPICEAVIGINGHEEYGPSPYSYLFCDLSTYEAATGSDVSEDSISIYAGHMRDLKKAFQSLSEQGYADYPYELTNVTEEKIEVGTLTSRSITSFAQIISWITGTTILLVVFLLILLWMRNNYKDISILISLGMSRSRIAIDYFVLCNLLICFALVLAGPICAAVIRQSGSDLLSYATAIMLDTALVESDALIRSALEHSMTFSDYVAAECKFLFLSWLSVAAALIKIFVCKPTVLFRIN